MPVRIPYPLRPPTHMVERFTLEINLQGEWHKVKSAGLGRISEVIKGTVAIKNSDDQRRELNHPPMAAHVQDLGPYANPLLRVYSDTSRELRWEGLLSTFSSLRKPTTKQDIVLVHLPLEPPRRLEVGYLVRG